MAFSLVYEGCFYDWVIFKDLEGGTRLFHEVCHARTVHVTTSSPASTPASWQQAEEQAPDRLAFPSETAFGVDVTHNAASLLACLLPPTCLGGELQFEKLLRSMNMTNLSRRSLGYGLPPHRSCQRSSADSGAPPAATRSWALKTEGRASVQ